jgi:uncharacterized protein YlxP (DUF503 family)
MVIALLTLDLYFPLNDSVRSKQGVLKSLSTRIRREFNVAVAEGEEDLESTTHGTLKVVCISQHEVAAHRYLQHLAHSIEELRMDAQMADFSIEMVG